MKYLLLLMFFITNTSFATWVKVSELEAGGNIVYYTKAVSCGDGCIKVPKDFGPDYYDLVDVLVDDYENPKYAAKTQAEACVDENDCIEKESAKTCTNGSFVVRTVDEVYCTRIVGYNKKTIKEVSFNNTKKAAHEAKRAAEAKKIKDKIEKDNLIKQQLKTYDCTSITDAFMVKLCELYKE